MIAKNFSSGNDNVGDHDTGEVLLDVRPIIERGEEPFGTIMQTVATLDGRPLRLVASFEPTPLQGVLSAQGFTYQSERVSDTEWRVRFEPVEEVPGGGARSKAPGASTTAGCEAEPSEQTEVSVGGYSIGQQREPVVPTIERVGDSVPFISWNRLRDRGIMRGPDGRALLFAHLVNQNAARLTFGLAVLGAGAGVLGALTATSWTVRVAGVPRLDRTRELGIVGLVMDGYWLSSIKGVRQESL